MSEFIVRKGKAEDIRGLLDLIIELAVYEKEPDAVIVTEDQLREDCFGDHPLFEFLVAEMGNEIAGIALYYRKYSTWKGRCMFLEDLVVGEKHRRLGIGQALFDELVAIAKKDGAMRLEWQVLDWNEPAINFYKRLNAQLDSEWINCKLDRNQIQQYQAK